ncbi:MAG: MBL fold metallo-hydrolase, partial [Chitinophagaceae bacterium]
MARILPLSEGVFTIGHDKLFLPFDQEADELNERSRGSLLVEIQPFLIELGNELILLDTGLGFANESGQLQIHQNIRNCGYEPSDITKVLLSHLHKDHAGGVAFKDKKGKLQPSFPEALYYIYG